ncbi:hypothetical protein CICLE_v10008955mg [Citrus x clementina]|uniref:Uncharacterized protein n=3 Tax=Citrus TaxID=2706 RepID=A0A067G434_CITSI|nr:uncharacterized protein LOC18054574 [Citrus x clementina]XP_006475259.1 uncharacterized protein LOC102621279 [Citrus sinensis]GAY53044.1 hypothetical protein CUMW_146380 [Citrus unshiu]ESR65363.1 hypothetical protein CICLE_v10008955mg [Citrus x clementina]KAH9803194.1 hypothetical protein KPL71_001671 [Citrus sinensis]KDO74399.1 hypothetical protein CISIN_1g021190mg [Citrus sinensis]
MGGGAAMRAAGKVAGIGVFNGGFRGGLSSATPTAQSLRNVQRPVAATISSGKVSGGDVAEAHKATWEMVDDWEFAGGVDDLPAEPMPRVVFGGAPSLEETKEATAELKDALDKVYLSSSNSNTSEHGDPFVVGEVSSMPLLANSEHTETKSCITYDLKSASVPKPAIQAFKLLSESPAAQSVVASIACDPAVWNAVVKNDALVEFVQSQKTNDMLQDQESLKIFEAASDSSQFGDTENQSADSGSFPMDVLETIKNKVVDMVNNVTGFLQNIFGFAAADKTSSEADAGGFTIDKTLGTAFTGLAMMVIVVVLLKRA